MSRILVKATIQRDKLQLKVISREYGSPFYFCIAKKIFMKLEDDDTLTPRDTEAVGLPRACFIRFEYTRELLICFVWPGLEQHVSLCLPYDDLAEFVRESEYSGAPKEWKCLSLEPPKLPRLVFHGKNLHSCLSNRIVRKKLVRFLRDSFPYDDVREIHFYDRVVPYSFTFRERCDIPERRVGALTLFNQQDISSAFYRVTSHFEKNPYPNYAAL